MKSKKKTIELLHKETLMCLLENAEEEKRGKELRVVQNA